MKKFTMMLIATMMVVFAQAANPVKRLMTPAVLPQKAALSSVALNAKPAPAALAKAKTSAKARAPKKAVAATSDELAGTYLWEFSTTKDNPNVDPSAVEATEDSKYVTIEGGDNNVVTISGMFVENVVGTYYPAEGYILIPAQTGYVHGTYGDLWITPLTYLEASADNEAGWYFLNYIYAYPNDDGTIELDGDQWLMYVIQEGQYAGYNLSPIWLPGSILTPDEGPQLVELPEGLTVEQYSMVYAQSAKETEPSASKPVYVAVDGNDVYFQGLSNNLPEAWVKGTKAGDEVTFAANQYLGEYGSYGSSYAFYNGAAVFTYDAETETYSAEGEIYGVLGGQYYDGRYFNPVLSKVVEKAAMPANPSISQIYSGNYGDEVLFDVPVVDVNGDGLLTSKLSFMFYTDVEKEVNPLTFVAGDDYPYLDQDITEIPFGFKDNNGEGWDFYDSEIFLNMAHNTWNKIGIKSIYRGGGEVNETEVQWFTMKAYAIDEAKNVLSAEITKAEKMLANESNTEGREEFSGAIAAAKQVLESEEATVADVNAAVQTLKDAEAAFVKANTNPDAVSAQWVAETWATDNTIANGTDVDAFNIDDNISATAMQNGGTSHPKYYTTGKALRLYAGNTLTIAGNEDVEKITKIVFTTPTGNYSGGNITAETGKYTFETTTGTWEGSATEVTFKQSGNSGHARIVSISVSYILPGSGTNQPELKEYTFDFSDGELGFWSTIDADGDGYAWKASLDKQLSGKEGVPGVVFSESYSNNTETALTPDNFLVSPRMALDGSITFWACAQDGNYPAEHFGVFVSTESNTSADDFEAVDAWNMTASRIKAPRKVQGNWYEYTVDLSTYAGQEGYVAIRHFDCTDQFMLVVDDITLTTSKLILPDYTITPAEGEVKSLGDFTLKFNNFAVAIVDGESAQAELYKDENFDEPFATAALSMDGDNAVTFSFGSIKEAGDYMLIIPDGILKNADNDKVLSDLQFLYTVIESPAVVELPDGAEVETWYFTANSSSSTVKGAEIGVAFVGNDIYVQGFNQDYIPDAWVKGTLNGDGTATFAAGQYFGEIEQGGELYDMFFVGYDGEDVSDVVFDVDLENGIMTTDDYIIVNSEVDEISYYEYYYNVQLTRDMPEFEKPLEAPEDLVTESYLFKGYENYYEEEESGREVLVGFYGDDEVWFHGLSANLSDAWVKGTIKNGVVTIPETYIGVYETIDFNTWQTVELETYFAEAEFVYDAEAGTFTSEEGFYTYSDNNAIDDYSNVVLTKVIETVATPADPSVAAFRLYNTPGEGDTELTLLTYPYVQFSIPTVSVDGNQLVQSKLSYLVYIVDANDEQKTLTFTTDLYKEIEEDMTEIPYTFDDQYDIYDGKVYLNQDTKEIASWKKIGVQSIYRGLGVENRSNIGWFDIEAYIGNLMDIVTGINSLTLDSSNARFFDLQGRSVERTTKGLLIMKTADGKTVKVVRK